MMWVKLTLPPRLRAMWLLMTIRLSIISFAGIVRTLVAVGTVSDSSMLRARAFVIPLRTVTWSSVSSAGSSAVLFSGASEGIGVSAAGLFVVRATGLCPITGIGAVGGLAFVDAGCARGCGGAACCSGGCGACCSCSPCGAAVADSCASGDSASDAGR